MRRWEGAIALASLVAVGSLAISSGGATPTMSVAAGPPSSLVVSPSTVTLGETVTVTGQCENGIPERVLLSLHRPAPAGFTEPQLVGHRTVTPAADGSFSGDLTVAAEAPPGSWEVSSSCGHTDVVFDRDEATLEVTGTPMTQPALLYPPTVRAGETLVVTGSGCTAEGISLEMVTTFVSAARPLNSPQGQHTSAQTAVADGGWTVSVPIPADFNPEQYAVSAQCQTATNTSSGMNWTWGIAPTGLTVTAPSAPPTRPDPGEPLARTG